MGRIPRGRNKLSTQHDGDNAETIQVLEPGPNSPTVNDVAKIMVTKIATNAEDMLNALIRLAKGGHYQAAQYLLSEMHRLGTELKDADTRSLSERLGPIVARLQAEYYKRQAITIDADPPSSSSPETETKPDEAPKQPLIQL